MVSQAKMKELKPLDYEILSELLKNSKTSDRKMAKKLGVSQPTVTRRRARLEKEVIDGYTAIPRWEKLGYEILAFSFFKCRFGSASNDEQDNAHRKCREWTLNRPCIIAAGKGMGMKMNCFIISFHKSYSDYDELIFDMQSGDSGYATATRESFLVSINQVNSMKPFHLKYLAKCVRT